MKSNIETYKFAKQFIGKGGAIFRSYCGLGKRDPYCNAYVTYILHKTDNASLYCDGKKQTYCPTSIKWCYNNLANIPPYLALPMDIVYFDWELNGIPNHIGFAKERKSDQVLLTHEGNTSGGIVAEKSRNTKYIQAVFRLHYPVTFDISKPLTVDGYFGYNSIAMLQKVLGLKPDGILGKQTVKTLQKIAGVSQDGSWGPKTSRAVQKMVGTKVDGAWGPASTKKLQEWINKRNGTVTASTPSTPVKTTNADKIVARAKDYAWAYGTAQSKWAYKTGSAKSSYKTALKKYLKHTTKIAQSDCGYFVTTCVRASGVSSSFTALRGVKESFPSVPSTMKIVWKGSKIPSGTLKAGDIVRYKKTSGSQHTLMYIGDGKIAEAGRKIRFPRIAKDTKKYNASGVKFSTIQVIRAK